VVLFMVTHVTKSNHFGFNILSIANDYMIRLYSYLVTNSIYSIFSHNIRAFKYIPIDHLNRGNGGNFGNRAFIRYQSDDLKFIYFGNFLKPRGNLK